MKALKAKKEHIGSVDGIKVPQKVFEEENVGKIHFQLKTQEQPCPTEIKHEPQISAH